METQSLLTELQQFRAFDDIESHMVQRTIRFVMKTPDCLVRSHLNGHITGSGWIVNQPLTAALLIHHAKLDKWFQPGGHADGEADILAVAKKEVAEEVGLELPPLIEGIFDVDIHKIPSKEDIPSHLHYDIRFIFVADAETTEFMANREIKAAHWVPFDQIRHYTLDQSILRMVEKTTLLRPVLQKQLS